MLNCCVAAGPRQAGGKLVAHRIGIRNYNDRYRARCALRGVVCRRSGSQHEVNFQAHQLCGQPVKAVRIAVRKTLLENKRLVFDIGQIAQSPDQRAVPASVHTRFSATEVKIAESVDFRLCTDAPGPGAGEWANRAAPRERGRIDFPIPLSLYP